MIIIPFEGPEITVEFVNNDKGLSYGAHKPHPDSSIKSYVMKQVLDFLMSNKIL